MALFRMKRSVLPGFGLSLGISLLAICLLVLIPVGVLIFTALADGGTTFLETAAQPRVKAATIFSLKVALFATLINLVFGTILAWVLVRYSFPGRQLINGLVDLPFALPTAVTGVTLASLYSPAGAIGRQFSEQGWIGRLFGPVDIAYTEKGVVLALVVVTLPFIVRTLQPVLETLEVELEEAGAVLGAKRWQVMSRIIFPELIPALLVGSGMMFARATAEYGSVIFIANNIPFDTEILPLVINGKLDRFDSIGAACVALLMLGISAVILLLINIAQWRYQQRLREPL